MTFGETLKRIRKHKEISQREVARRVGMDHARFSRLENDRTGFNPTRETVERIASALETNEDERNELLAAAGRLDKEIELIARAASKDPVVAKLLRLITKLSQDQVKKLLERIETDFSLSSKENVSDLETPRMRKRRTGQLKNKNPNRS